MKKQPFFIGDIPAVELSNGIKIANFSSPHSFLFADNSELPECSQSRARLLILDYKEIEEKNVLPSKGITVTDIHLRFEMSEVVCSEIHRIGGLKTLNDDPPFDILLVPLPVMQSIKSSDAFKFLINKDTLSLPNRISIRGIRSADRATKTVHIDRFCM